MAIPHIIQDGSRLHAVWWDEKGAHCKEPNCEMNFANPPSDRPLRPPSPLIVKTQSKR